MVANKVQDTHCCVTENSKTPYTAMILLVSSDLCWNAIVRYFVRENRLVNMFYNYDRQRSPNKVVCGHLCLRLWYTPLS